MKSPKHPAIPEFDKEFVISKSVNMEHLRKFALLYTIALTIECIDPDEQYLLYNGTEPWGVVMPMVYTSYTEKPDFPPYIDYMRQIVDEMEKTHWKYGITEQQMKILNIINKYYNE